MIKDQRGREPMDQTVYLVAAYGIIWLALFIYLFSLGRKQRRLANTIAALRKSLESEFSSS